jgi:hypothetical protein
MKRIVIVLALTMAAVAANAQVYYPDSNNPDMTRYTERHEPCRKEIVIPSTLNGYNVYKADLHTHSIFSDGLVHPKWRVYEAWQDGLDVMAVTEHIENRAYENMFHEYLKEYTDKEYQKGPAGLKNVDINFSIREAKKEAVKYGITIIPGSEITRSGSEVGHFNALFTTDNNLIYDEDPVQSIRNAKSQGALVMHNHPGWRRKDIKMTPTEKTAYGEGLIDGVEVMNGGMFFPGIIDRVREYNQFIAANTDVHKTTASDYRLTGADRPMTLILAKDKSLESLREALLQRRTIAFGFNTLCGSEELLRDFFHACVKVTKINETSVLVTNMTSITFKLQQGKGRILNFDPFTSMVATVKKGSDTVSYRVVNMWTGVDSHPVIELKAE